MKRTLSVILLFCLLCLTCSGCMGEPEQVDDELVIYSNFQPKIRLTKQFLEEQLRPITIIFPKSVYPNINFQKMVTCRRPSMPR